MKTSSKISKKLNCWEFMDCKREAVCPVAKCKVFNGINKGKAGGRICWSIANKNGDICFSKNTETVTISCLKCPFYSKLIEHEFELLRTLS